MVQVASLTCTLHECSAYFAYLLPAPTTRTLMHTHPATSLRTGRYHSKSRLSAAPARVPAATATLTARMGVVASPAA